MARKKRVEFAGAVYHLTARGNNKKAIFHVNDDRAYFLVLLAETVQRFDWRCYAYCLMDNHYHILVETPQPTLSAGMKFLNGTYTQAYNRNQAHVGHLFQGRFHSVLIEKESYLKELARYIVLNPVRAGMVKRPENWRWSSYRATAGIINSPPFLSVDWLLANFSTTKNRAQRAYAQFVNDGRNYSPWSRSTRIAYLGSERFIKKMQGLEESRGIAGGFDNENASFAKQRLIEIASKCETKTQAIFAAYQTGSYTQRELADHFKLSAASICRIVKRA